MIFEWQRGRGSRKQPGELNAILSACEVCITNCYEGGRFERLYTSKLGRLLESRVSQSIFPPDVCFFLA